MIRHAIELNKEDLQQAGWNAVQLGQTRSNGKIKSADGFLVFVRDRNLDDFLKKSSQRRQKEPCKIKASDIGQASPTGKQKNGLTPSTHSSPNMPSLADFENYPSLTAARPDSPCILIGYDSEWENLDSGDRLMLSWQFAVVWNRRLIEILFIRDGCSDLSLSLALGFILDYIGAASVDARKIRRYAYCSAWRDGKPVITETADLNDARENCVYVYRSHNTDGRFTHEVITDMDDRFVSRSKRDWAYFHTYLDYKTIEHIKVTIVCHAGKFDLTGFSDADCVLNRLSEIQGGLVSLQRPISMAPKSLKNANNTCLYPVSLHIRDSMCHAPAGMKKLKNLGDAVGICKVDIPDVKKEHMIQFLEDDPAGFAEYASTDSVVTLMYISALYGWNNNPPVTVTSSAALIMRKNMMEYLGLDPDDAEGFNRLYRGLEKISHGKCRLPDRPGFCENTSLEPVSDKACTIQRYASGAYHGGYNSCCEVGFFTHETHDYDLRNAYPTAMCLVPDIDWSNPIKFHIQNRDMDIRDFLTPDGLDPVMPFVGYCRFCFPESVKFPCIPVNVDGVPMYPRSSEELDGVYVAGPYIYLALRLGASVFCENGYFLNSLVTPDLHVSRSLSHAVIQFVKDRNHAVAEHGKKSLAELILKTMVNAGYGKNSQNVVQKNTWSAYKDSMEDIGCSVITNPVSAMMTTSIVQCVLLACQNQLHALSYMSCSVTTDGFIADIPYDELTRLDLFGFRQCMEQARLFLTDGEDAGLWEEKHHQNDLLNFTTRGNVSLLSHGVCAHNSAKSIYENDSYEDRLWLMTKVLSRSGTVDCTDKKFSSFKDIVLGKTDFCTSYETRHLRMDFDLKRKPDRDSFTTDYPVIDGVTYEIAHFDTVPYDTVAEFRLYRKKKDLCKCLRTVDEWKSFFLKVDTDGCGCVVKDLDWSILVSVIMGYRSGKWDIPAINGKTVSEKCAWINKHNSSSRKFKESDWKNARRPERQSSMLPAEFLKDKLSELQNSD